MTTVQLWLLKLGGITLIFIGLYFGYLAWHKHVDSQGYNRANGEWAVYELSIKGQAEERKAKEDALVAKRQAELDATNKSLLADNVKLKVEHEKSVSKYEAAALAGTIRLRIATSNSTSTIPRSQQSEDTGSTTGVGTETADLLPETAAAILRIAGGSAGDVQDFNTLVGLYEAAQKACNAPEPIP